MTQSYQRNLARHMLLARQGGNGNGNGNGNGGHSLSSSTTADSSTSSTPSSTPPSSSAPQTFTTSSVKSEATTPSPSTSVVRPSTTSSSTSTLDSKTSSSTITTSSTTSSTIRSTSSIPTQTSSILANSNVYTNQFTETGLSTDAPTGIESVGATASATSLNSSVGSGMSAGSIVGAVAGTLVGLAVLGFLIAFLLRRYRRSRRRAMRDSDFGTFRRSIFVTPRSTAATPTMPDMSEAHHNIAPSLNEPYIPHSSATAQPPSQALAASNAADTAAANGGSLQERPKYVYGQDPSPANQQRQYDDSASDIAYGGAYSSEPQVQGAYNVEAYGSYAKYEDVGNGIVGGVPAGTAVYQDAQRAYQGQQGYDQSDYATYDPSHYEGYGQQQQHYQAYASGSSHAGAYDAI